MPRGKITHRRTMGNDNSLIPLGIRLEDQVVAELDKLAPQFDAVQKNGKPNRTHLIRLAVTEFLNRNRKKPAC